MGCLLWSLKGDPIHRNGWTTSDLETQHIGRCNRSSQWWWLREKFEWIEVIMFINFYIHPFGPSESNFLIAYKWHGRIGSDTWLLLKYFCSYPLCINEHVVYVSFYSHGIALESHFYCECWNCSLYPLLCYLGPHLVPAVPCACMLLDPFSEK